jgi:hypothetical protein
MKNVILSAILVSTCLLVSSFITAPSSSVTIKTDDCLLSYQGKLNQLLPLDLIKKYYKGDLTLAKLTYKPSATGKFDRDSYTYTWPGDRKMEGSAYKQSNQIGLKWVKIIDFYNPQKPPIEVFNHLYRNPTEAEKEQAFKEAEKGLNERGVSQKDVKNTIAEAKSIAATTKYLRLQGVGEAAAWEYSSNYLIVLAGKVTFRVIANVSTNTDENIELARNLALEILGKCK